MPERVTGIDPAAVASCSPTGRRSFTTFSRSASARCRPGPTTRRLPIASLVLRPLGELLRKIDALEERLRRHPGPFHLVVVGGGASGCELALAIHKRLGRHPGFRLTLLQGNARSAAGISRPRPRGCSSGVPRARHRLPAERPRDRRRRRLRPAGRRRARGVRRGALGDQAGAAPAPPRERPGRGRRRLPARPRHAAVGRRPGGLRHRRLRVLRVASRPAARTAFTPSAKGPSCSTTWPRSCTSNRCGRSGRSRSCLSLLNTADGQAILSYGPLAWKGRWARRLKDRIDRAWMDKFTRFAPMTDDGATRQAPTADALRRLRIENIQRRAVRRAEADRPARRSARPARRPGRRGRGRASDAAGTVRPRAGTAWSRCRRSITSRRSSTTRTCSAASPP